MMRKVPSAACATKSIDPARRSSSEHASTRPSTTLKHDSHHNMTVENCKEAREYCQKLIKNRMCFKLRCMGEHGLTAINTSVHVSNLAWNLPIRKDALVSCSEFMRLLRAAILLVLTKDFPFGSKSNASLQSVQEHEEHVHLRRRIVDPLAVQPQLET